MLFYGISYRHYRYYGKFEGLKLHVNYFTVSMGDQSSYSFTVPFALGAHKAEAKVLAGLPPPTKAGRGGCGCLVGLMWFWQNLVPCSSNTDNNFWLVVC